MTDVGDHWNDALLRIRRIIAKKYGRSCQLMCVNYSSSQPENSNHLQLELTGLQSAF